MLFRSRLKVTIGTEYVRPILLDGGGSKNALFFLTRNPKGMMLMNKIVWDNTYDGRGLKAKKDKTLPLFPPKELRTSTAIEDISLFEQRLEQKIKKNKMKNTEIIEFTAIEGFLPEHARIFFEDLRKNGRINISYLQKEKTRGLYIAENNWNKELCVIEYVDN